MSEKSLTHGIKFKDKIGYAMGDMGGLLTFSLIGAFQNKFYTDVLHIQPAKIVVLILVARLWDAINDPIWGAFIDSRKPTKQGKFRPYVFWFSIPLAVSAVLMFTVIPNLSAAKYLLFAYITYILYGMMYTCVNIPYGSLASVVTDDEKERSSLSMWRSIGSRYRRLAEHHSLSHAGIQHHHRRRLHQNSNAERQQTDHRRFDPGHSFHCDFLRSLQADQGEDRTDSKRKKATTTPLRRLATWQRTDRL